MAPVTERRTQSIQPFLWLSLLVYLLLSVLMTWPLAQHLGTHFPSPDTDVFNVFWGDWWVRYALGAGQNPYQTQYLIYPEGFNLLSFAFSPFLALLWIPLSWILSPIVAYNLVLLLTIVLCCVAMDLLMRYLTGDGWAALVAGITFGFAPALVAERVVHLNMATLFWIPWAALLLTRLMREAKVRDAILLAVSVGLAFLTRLQVGVLVTIFCSVYFVGLALVERKQWHKSALRWLLLAGVLSLLLLSPLLIFAWQTVQQPGGESLLRWDAEQNQSDLVAYVVPPQRHPLFGTWTETIHEERFGVNRQYWAYLGLVPLLLAVYAAAARPRQALPWLLVGLAFFVLALGPYLRVNGQLYEAIRLPYGWASGLFSSIGFNWPNRFNLAVMAALSALVGLACAQIHACSGKAWLLGIVASLIVIEFLVVPWEVALAPPDSAFYDQMAADAEDYAIVDLPLERQLGEVHRYYQTLHHKPIVGGWDHRVPPSALGFIQANPLLATWQGNDQQGVPLDQALVALADANVRYIVVHKQQIASVPERLRFLLGTLKPVYQDRNILALPAGGTSCDAYNVVRWFGKDLALIRPVALLELPMDGSPPQLSLYTCWLKGGQADSADRYQLSLMSPAGSLVFEGTASLPDTSQGMACQTWTFEQASVSQAGVYTVAVSPLSAGQLLGTYSVPQQIYSLETRRGTLFPAMGYMQEVAFEAPMNLLGYNMVGGDNFVWVDLFWRSTEKHGKTHFLSVELVEPRSGQSVVSEKGLIEKYEWKKGDLFQERRILWLDDVPPGEYALGVSLDGAPVLDRPAVQVLAGNVALMDISVEVLPVSQADPLELREGRIIVYTRHGGIR